ncbi:MAG: hypothetical protein HC862_29310 [Scytonema sp. RU_4_4]|nr:hypothetical protein [Scytonema sp. RU_4_4]NJR73069.1 hypothetical protein [Scytonema sp. CRU_2_7]
MAEDAAKFAEKIGVVAHNSTVNIHNQNIGISDNSGATPINWREVCQNKFQQQLDINRQRRRATEKAFELDIYVPLGLVERKQQPRRSEDISPEKGMLAYQLTEEVIKTTYEHEKFLTEVIGDGSNTKGNSTAIDALFEALVELFQNSSQSFDNIRWVARSLQIIAKGNPKAIKDLELLIDQFESDDIKFDAASILGEIDVGNSKAIHTLVRLIREYPNNYTPQNAANVLCEIAKGNSIAISALVELVMLIEEFRNEYTPWNIVKILCEIPNDDLITISALVILIQWFLSEEIFRLVMMILGEIATKGNSEVINALVQFLHDSQPENIRWQAVSALGKIDPDNPKVSDTTVELIQNLQSKDTREQVKYNLWTIDLNHPKIIDAVIKLVQNPRCTSIHGQVALASTKIDSGNPKAIKLLECLIQNSQQTHVIAVAGRVIERIDPGNLKVIETLGSLAQNSHQPEDVRLQAAESLEGINPGNPRVIETLRSLAQNSQDEEILLSAARRLMAIGAGDSTTIDTLKSLVLNSQDIATYQQAAGALKILREDWREEVIPDFKDYLSVKANKNDYKRYYCCYEIIWHWAQNMPYASFYQAWHHRRNK